MEASNKARDLTERYEQDCRRKKTNPERLPPEQLQELTDALVQAQVIAHNLHESGSALIERREPDLLAAEPRTVEAQYLMTELIAAVPATSKTRAVAGRREKPVTHASQAALF